jgi:hypothetical protein
MHAPARADRCSLELQFTSASSASVFVRIADAQGREVLSAPAAGSVLRVELPPGRYRAVVLRDGRVEMRAFELTGGRPLRLVFDRSAAGADNPR